MLDPFKTMNCSWFQNISNIRVIKKFCVLMFFLAFQTANAQTYGWLTTIRPGGNEYCWDVAADEFGNFFGTGRVKANSTFGTTPFTASPPPISVAETDVFIAKYRKNGKLAWVKREGGIQPDWGRCVTADKDGNALIAGDYCDTANFGSFHLSKIGVATNRNIFVAKYDSVGNCLWAKFAGNAANYSRGYGITTDNAGNVYVGGHVSGPTNFDGKTFGVTGKNLPFLAKFSPSGNCIWAKHITCSTSGAIHDIIYNTTNHKFYAAGSYRGNITINSVTYPGNSPSWSDVFVLEVDSSGAFGWIKTAIGNYEDAPYGIELDSSGNIYVGGRFANDLTFNTTTIFSKVIGATATIANAHANGFITKYNPSGTVVWVETILSDTLVALQDIAVTKSGKVMVVSSVLKTVYLQDDTIPHLFSTDKSLLSCYDLDKNQLWFKVTGTGDPVASRCLVNGISTNGNNDVIMGGEYLGSTCNFDSFNVISGAGFDGWLAKLYMPLNPTIKISDSILCVGDTLTFDITQEGSEIGIAWLSVPSGLNFISSSNPYTAVVTGAFTYSPSIQINNPMQSVTVNFSNTISALAFPVLNIPDTIVCPTTAVTYDLDSTLFYSWYDTDMNSDKTISTTGNFWVQVTNQNGCTITDTFLISNYTVNDNVLTNSVNACMGDSVNVTMNPGYFTPTWYDASTGFSHFFSTPGNYSIIAIDANGCNAYDTVLVNGLVPVTFSLGNDTAFCSSTFIDLLAPASHSGYIWSDSSADSLISVGTSGIVCLNATDGNGCTYTDSVFVSEIFPSAFSLGTDSAICPGDIVDLFAPISHSAYAWSTGSSLTSISVNVSGTYWLTAFDGNGCGYTDSLNITVNIPTAFSLGTDSTFCNGSMVDIFAPAGFSNYNWSDGSTSAILTVDTTQVVWLSANDLNNCVSSDTIVVTLDPCLSVTEINLEGFNCWPNPFSDHLVIEFALSVDQFKISILNLAGQNVYSQTFYNESKQIMINTGRLPTGVYGLFITTAEGNYFKKIIKQ